MKYVVLLYQDERVWDEASLDARSSYVGAHEAFERAVRESATVLAGEALTPVATATTLRHDPSGARVVTDGPFAEAAEQLGGFYLVDAADLDVMLELCAVLPHHYTVEVRPVADMTQA